jgi:hypothetical protein
VIAKILRTAVPPIEPMVRHPEGLGAKRRASKGDGPLDLDRSSFEGRFRGHLRMTVNNIALRLLLVSSTRR